MDKKIIYSAIAFLAAGAISYQTWSMINKEAQIETLNTTVQNQSNTKKTTTKNVNGKVSLEKNGNNFLASKNYVVEEDKNSIKVALIIDNKIIKSVEVTHTYGGPISKTKHQLFDEKLDKNALIGRDISTVDISNVTGATWTTNAFKSVIKEVAINL